MASVNYYAELTVAITRLFFIFLGIMVSIEIINKTSGRLKKAIIYFLVTFIPSIFYTIGRLLNIESLFASGKLLSLTFNTLTTIFILFGLYEINNLIKGIKGTHNPTKNKNKPARKFENRKVNKGINIKNIIKRGRMK